MKDVDLHDDPVEMGCYTSVSCARPNQDFFTSSWWCGNTCLPNIVITFSVKRDGGYNIANTEHSPLFVSTCFKVIYSYIFIIRSTKRYDLKNNDMKQYDAALYV
jgi:hypothetical protein